MHFDPNRDRDTICARSTPPGYGGIAIVRVSGEDSLKIIEVICPSLAGKMESHRARLTHVIAQQKEGAKVIDEVLVTPFVGQNSYTGETSVEISCHGNPLIVREVLETLVEKGARIAQPGEFTYRAFMNGKIDLVQAESVLSVIESESTRVKNIALDQLKGSLSEKITSIENDLTWLLANFEASIDFSHEDIDVLPFDQIRERTIRLTSELEELVDSYKGGRLLKEGLKVAIVGAPNAGKSSLLNALVNDDRAIVSEVAGTTRDTIEGELSIEGVLVKFIDTAGIRPSEDSIERAGIERSHKAMASADLVLHVVDGLTLEKNGIETDKPVILVVNKSDALKPGSNKIESGIYVSATEKSNLDEIKRHISSFLEKCRGESSTSVVQARQNELFKHILEKVKAACSQIEERDSLELVSLDLQESLQACFELQGKVFDDEVMDRVFNEFCIGK